MGARRLVVPVLAAFLGAGASYGGRPPGTGGRAGAEARGPAETLDRTRRLAFLRLEDAAEVRVLPDRPGAKEPWSTGVTIEPFAGRPPAIRALLRRELAGLDAGAGCPADQRLAGLLAPSIVEAEFGPGWESELGLAGPPEDVLEGALPELAAEVARMARAKGDRDLGALAFMVTRVGREPTARRDRLHAALGLGAAVTRLEKAYRTLAPAPRRGKGRRGDPAMAWRIYEALASAGRRPAAPPRADDPASIALAGAGAFAAGRFELAEAAARELARRVDDPEGWEGLGREDPGAAVAALDLFGRMDVDSRAEARFEDGLSAFATGALASAPRTHRERFVLVAAAARYLARFHGQGRDGVPVAIEVAWGKLQRPVGTGPGRGLSPRLHLSPLDLAAADGRIRLTPRSGPAATVRVGWWGE